MSSAKVTDKKTTQLLWLLIKFPPKFLAFHREKPIHSYLGFMSYIKPTKGINFKEFKEFTKKYYLTLEQGTLKYNFNIHFI